VYNSAALVGQTVDQTVAFFERHQYHYEVILVNDGSPDQSWSVIREKALHNPRIIAIDLLKNYGQHTALLCGFQHSQGDYVITLDDDLQNPPEEIENLIQATTQGYDVVFGQFRKKEHAGYRRLGTRLIGLINRHVFEKPADLVLSNFRIIRRDVVDRICSYRTAYPYIPGLVLMFSSNPGNVWVEHRKRPVGKSNYNFRRILTLMTRILFNYSAVPLQFVSTIGLIVSVASMLYGLAFLVRGAFIGSAVPGWTSVVVLLSFLNGINLLVMGVLGEYVVRLVNQSSAVQSYHVQTIVSRRPTQEVMDVTV
jgi:glycosyltransferase involved in cell wall biosynthesis